MAGDPHKKPDPMVARAEADAKLFAYRHNLMNPEDAHTGGVVPPVFYNGQQIPYGSPLPNQQKKYAPNPRDATEFKYNNGEAFYVHPQTGDLVEMDPAFINLPQFKKLMPVPQGNMAYKRNTSGGIEPVF